MIHINKMTKENAYEISHWIYAQEYSIYSFSDDESTIWELMNGDYFSYINANGELIGYFCFGQSACIPCDTNYVLGEGKMDIGLGMRPDLCGYGNGRAFMERGIEFAKNNFDVKCLRLVVAEFNKRAITVYEQCDFVKVAKVKHKISKMEFWVMERSL